MTVAAASLRGWLPALLFWLSCACVLPTTATASVFDVYGMTARGTAMGGAQGAAADDHAGVYYNPATMTRRKKVHFGATVQLIVPQLTIDAPESPRESALPSTNMGVTIGAVFPLGGKIEDRIAFGVALFLPVIELTRLDAIDPATPQSYLYESLPDGLVIAAALAVEVTDWLSLGVGVQLLADFQGDLQIDLNLEQRRVERREIKGDIFGEVGLILGLTLGPFEGVTFGFTYRDDFGLPFHFPLKIAIDRVGVLSIDPTGQGIYAPDQYNWALAWETPWAPLLLAFDLTWMRWSAAPSPAVVIEAVLDDTGLRPDAEEPGVVLNLPSTDSALGAKDTLVPHFGAEYRFVDWFAAQLGYVYRATPIPDQVGYTNYADNDAHLISLGASFTWDDPLEVHNNPVSLDVFFQVTALEPRETVKNSDLDFEEIRDWTSSGRMWNLGVEFRHDF